MSQRKVIASAESLVCKWTHQQNGLDHETLTHWVSHELLQVGLLLVESRLPPSRCPPLLLLVLTHILARKLP